MNDDVIYGYACPDCVMFVANNDDSGNSDEWDINDVVETLNQYDIIIEDETHDFMTYPCEVCGNKLAGFRQTVIFDPR